MDDVFEQAQTQIKPDYYIVKYKILESYYKSQEYMVEFTKTNNGQFFELWISELKILYLRIKGKMVKDRYKKKYGKTIEFMDKMVNNKLVINTQLLTIITTKIYDFIDEIGLTKIEQRDAPGGSVFEN